MIPQNSNRLSLPVSAEIRDTSNQSEIRDTSNQAGKSDNPSCSSSRLFSPSHRRGASIPTSSLLNNQNPIIVKSYQGMGIFDSAVFSQPFAKRYHNAKALLNSPGNRKHFEQTGEFSPEAKKAVDKFLSIVAGKSSSLNTTSAPRQVFLEGPLNEIEVEAWTDFVAALPPDYLNTSLATNNWQPVSTTELRQALLTEPGFAPFIDTPKGNFFVSDLATVINQKSAGMLVTDKGMALTMRFDSTYDAVSHVALASLWRDDAGKLCMGICHQESMPANNTNRKLITGVTYNTFDSSKDYPGQIAPVIESMKFAGLPSVNVFPCPNPKAIINTTNNIAGMDKAHPYGPTETWGNKRQYADKKFETCFNVTHKVMAKLYNVKTQHQPTLPDILKSMRPLVAISPDEFNEVTVEVRANNNQDSNTKIAVSLDDIESQKPLIQIPVFQKIGMLWGLSMPWDVNKTTDTIHLGKKVMKPGQTGLVPASVKGATQFKIIAKSSGLQLHGADVLTKKSYSLEELSQMTYTGTKDETFVIIGSVPRSAATETSRAKL